MDRPKRLTKSERSGYFTQTWYIVQGARGAVQFLLMVPTDKLPFMNMMALDFGLHSPTPLYEGQEATMGCRHTGGGTCYYSGSTKLAQDVLAAFQRSQDPEIIWIRLEEAYGSL